MKPTAYKRGKYDIMKPKEKQITFLTDKLMTARLKQLSEIRRKPISQIIRDAITEYYNRTLTNNGCTITKG
jgi:hypothetical protein